MERREFLKVGGASVAFGLSGCVEPVQDVLPGEEEPSDNNMDDEQPEVLVYRDLVPESGYRESDGVLAIHVDLDALEAAYSDPYRAYDGLPLQENEVALSTGNALLSVEPVIDDSLNDNHPLSFDVKSGLGFNSDSDDLGVSEYLLVENILFLRTDLTVQTLETTYDMTEVESSEQFGTYADTTGSYYAGFNGEWLAVPLEDANNSSLMQDVNNTVNNDGLYDGPFGDAFGDRGDGIVDVAAWKSGLDGVVSSGSSDVSGIASSAFFDNGVETSTGILFSDGTTDFVDDVGQDAESRDEQQDGTVVTVTTTWNQNE